MTGRNYFYHERFEHGFSFYWLRVLAMMHALTVGTNSSDIKLHNLSAILLTLLQQDNVSRAHLAQVLGVSSATITNLVTELSTAGYVAEGDVVRVDGQVGRPQRVLQLVPQSRMALGIHMDVDTSYIGLCDLRGSVIDRETVAHRDADPDHVLQTLITAVERLLARHEPRRTQIIGVGVGASGLVNTHTGTNVIAPHLHWHDVPIGAVLEKHLPYPVTVENNVRAMALGEALLGSATDTHALAFIYGRIGVGAGFVVGGQLFRGAAAGAGEIGHTIFSITDGHNMQIKRLETLVSEQTISALGTAIVPQVQGFEAILAAARNGHHELQAMLAKRAFYLGLAIANLVNIFNPELIVLGGIFKQAHDLMLNTIRETVADYAFANLGQQVSITTATFGNDAGMIGAAALALDSFFYRPQLRSSIQQRII